jgi:hypothetical protein
MVDREGRDNEVERTFGQRAFNAGDPQLGPRRQRLSSVREHVGALVDAHHLGVGVDGQHTQ